MQLVTRSDRGEQEVDVALAEGLTLGAIGGALLGGDAPSPALLVDGRLFSGDLPVADVGISAGAVLSAHPVASGAGVVELRVVAGPGAGLSVRLAAGLHLIGSGPGATVALRTPAVRPHHGMLEVTPGGRVSVVTAAGARRPLLAAGLVRIGGSLLEWAPIAADPPEPLRTMPGLRGTVPFNRPPRVITEHPATTIPLPTAAAAPPPRARIGLVALIVPILFGITMAVVVHPRMALFALLGPVMMFAGWADDRRRARRFRRTSAVELAAAVATFEQSLDRARTIEVLRRRRTHPTLGELATVAGGGSCLWERRPWHGDFMRLVIGYGAPGWRPPLVGDPAVAPPEVVEAIALRSRLPTTSVTVALRAPAVVGIAGERTAALDLARSLVVQAAMHHGPADLRIAVVTDQAARWDWAKWLPHTVAEGGGERRLLAATPEEVGRLAALVGPPPPPPPAPGLLGATPVAAPQGTRSERLTLLVVDVPDLTSQEGAPLRRLLSGRRGGMAGIVIAATRTRLPSMCTTVALVTPGTVRCTGTEDGDVELIGAGAAEPVARGVARRLAGFDDPEVREPGAELPAAVALLDLLGMAQPTAEAIAARWRAGGSAPAIAAPVGVTEAGPLMVDLVRDGPHGLLAGTTGSGKSELLRTLVASLAATVDPEHLTFVLIDYKGGSAFDACAGLPHTVGVVTDLDDRLAERALRCLEAELRHREQRLREAGADHLAAYLASDRTEPLPHMVIVVDEFAALARELPDFMDALVDIAGRGRSLGVHLLLATQRPAGVVRETIRANTNLRIALRVQDRTDSADVLGDPGAAAIARSQPGRGLVRLGPGEVIPFQTALVSGPIEDGGVAPIRTRPFRFALEQEPFPQPSPSMAAGGPTQLEAIVAAVVRAAEVTGMRPARRPWPDPLPAHLTVADLPSADRPTVWSVPVGLRDEPDRQRQVTHWWSPDDGPLLVYGLTGSGTTTALAALVIGLAKTAPPSQLHAYVLDFDAGGTAPLAGLPQVGAVVGPAQRERQVRLIRRLASEVERRKAGLAAHPPVEKPWPRVVVAVDNFAGFTGAFDAATDASVREAMARIIGDGPGVGVVAVVTATRTNAVPLALASAVPNRLVLRMADPLAAAALGLRSIPGDLPVGRAIDVTDRREIQLAVPHPDGVAAAVAEVAATVAVAGDDPSSLPAPVEDLPIDVPASRIAGQWRIGEERWFLPVGIGDTDLAVVGFSLGPGDHVLIAGEARSGRSSLLATIAALALQGDGGVNVTAVALRPSPLRTVAERITLVTESAELPALDGLAERPGPQLVLVDDADAVDDNGVLLRLAHSRRPDLHVIAAGRRDLKTHYQHWAKELCRSRIGLWLRPSPGLDGDLWSTPMPRHVPAVMPHGRGFLVGDGRVEVVQTARV